jgi:hypothetical protein
MDKRFVGRKEPVTASQEIALQPMSLTDLIVSEE